MPKKNPNEYLADLGEVEQTIVRLMVRAIGFSLPGNEPRDDEELAQALLGVLLGAMADLVRTEIARDVAAGGDGNIRNAIIRLAMQREAAKEQEREAAKKQQGGAR